MTFIHASYRNCQTIAQGRKVDSINHITQSGHHHMLSWFIISFERRRLCIALLHFITIKNGASSLKWCIQSFKIKSIEIFLVFSHKENCFCKKTKTEMLVCVCIIDKSRDKYYKTHLKADSCFFFNIYERKKDLTLGRWIKYYGRCDVKLIDRYKRKKSTYTNKVCFLYRHVISTR